MPNPIPTREPEAGRAYRMLAVGMSLILHGTALAYFYWFRDLTPPEPVKVIAVELVRAADIAGSWGTPATDRSLSSRALERTISEFAPAAADPHQPVPGGNEDKTSATAKARSEATATGIDAAGIERPPELESAATPPRWNEPNLRQPNLPRTAHRSLIAERSVGPSSLTPEADLPPPIPRATPARPNRPNASVLTEIASQDEPERLKDVSHKPVVRWAPRDRVEPDASRVAEQLRQRAKPEPRADHAPAVVAAVGRGRVDAGTGGGPAALPRFGGAELSNPPPRYPYLARRRGQEGRVLLRVRVSSAGDAAAVSIRRSSGYRLLDDAAVEAVREWRFVPASRGESPVAGTVDVPITFKLTD